MFKIVGAKAPQKSQALGTSLFTNELSVMMVTL